MNKFLHIFFVLLFVFIGLNSQTLFIPNGTSGISTSNRNGSVGVGTSNPRAYFDIYPLYANSLKSVLARLSEGDQTGEGTFLGVRSYNSQPESGQPCCNLKSFSLEHAFYGQINSSVNFYRGGGYTGGFITFNTNNNTEMMRIDAYGNVGIGTSSPQNKISINGLVGIYGEGLNGTTYQRTVIYSDATNGLYFDAPLRSDNTGVPINFGWRGGSPKITFLPSGNVLIGKTTQSNSNYRLDVVGKIRADEIIVNTTGADFVFEPTYKLRSLAELEAFIKANKHLPDIAPAREMQENGVSAGEMQSKLLQKVEELTLYVIELEKKISEKDAKLLEQNMLLSRILLRLDSLEKKN